MTEPNILQTLKQILSSLLPNKDGRSSVSPLDFVIHLIFCYSGDSKTSSLESIRREMKSRLDLNLSKSAFWERLSRNRLKHFLKQVVSHLMSQLATTTLQSVDVLTGLGVSQILLVDSCTISLWDGAKTSYPGTLTKAGIKWHACFDLLSGVLYWFELTPSSTHDSQCFPEIEKLKGKLLIFDLGYWDFGLLLALEKAKAFFLSRLKSNVVIQVHEVISGISKSQVGQSLKALRFKGTPNAIVEIKGKKTYKGTLLIYRVIGFWNPSEKQYHWYITNLSVPAQVIYPLYRLRWQIELIFKSCKQSLNTNRLTTNNSNIIESLLMASIAAHLISTSISQVALEALNQEVHDAISTQRLAKIAAILAKEFALFFTRDKKNTSENWSKRFSLWLMNYLTQTINIEKPL